MLFKLALMKTILLELQINVEPPSSAFGPFPHHGAPQGQPIPLAPCAHALNVDRNFIERWQFAYKTSTVCLISMLALRLLRDAKTTLGFKTHIHNEYVLEDCVGSRPFYL